MTNYEIQIDRMVDGELSQEEQRELLLACESDDRWRELALAYVESQAFGSVLGAASFFEPENRPTQATAPTVSVRSNEKSDLGWSVMSLAAAILLSLGLGYGLGWWWQDDGAAPVNLATNEGAAPTNNAVAKSNPNKASTNTKLQTMPFLVSDPVADELRQVDLPVVNASDLGPNWRQEISKSRVPEETLRELRSHGLNVKQTRTLTRVRLPDGRLMVVPIDYFIEQPFQ